LLWHDEGYPVAGTTRPTVYKWIKRYERQGMLTVRMHALGPVDVQADTGAQGIRAVSTPGEDPAVATFEWLALRGELSTMAGRYVHHGRPVLREVADVLDQLIQTGCLVLGAPRPGGRQPVHATVAGYVRYTELAQRAHPWPEQDRD
jgi:hypothetical protein